jgi:hypothetical protein
MYSLTYDLWNLIIEEAVDAYAPMFETMHNVADGIELSRSLVEELKLKGIKELTGDNRQFLLTIEPHDDKIGGFKISLLMAERIDAFEKVNEEAVASQGFSLEDVRNFEAEHGVSMADGVLDGIEEEFEVLAEKSEEGLIFELVVFDSEDIDNNSRMANGAWK